MKSGDPLAETIAEARTELRRERDLGDQHQRGFAAAQGVLDQA